MRSNKFMKRLFLFGCHFQQVTNGLFQCNNAKVRSMNVAKQFFIQFVLGGLWRFLVVNYPSDGPN